MRIQCVPVSPSFRAIKGGCFDFGLQCSQISYRGHDTPCERGDYLGVRMVWRHL